MRLGIVMAVLVAMVGSAEAMCITFRDAVTPRSGEVLPPNPVLYVFSQEGTPPVVWAQVDGRAVALRRDYLGPMYGRIAVWRLHFPATQGRLVVTMARDSLGPIDRVLEYRVDPAWHRPLGRLEVTRRWVSKYEWSCSFEDAVYFSLSVRAPAYRVEWAPTKQAFDEGQRTTQFFPSSKNAFVPDGDVGEKEGSLALGHISCFGQTFSAPPLGVYLEVTPLFADGDTPYVPPISLDLRLDVHHWDLALRAGWMFGLCLVSLGLFLRVVQRRRRF